MTYKPPINYLLQDGDIPPVPSSLPSPIMHTLAEQANQVLTQAIELGEEHRKIIAQLQADKAELLEALKLALEYVEEYESEYPGFNDAWDIGTALITKYRKE